MAIFIICTNLRDNHNYMWQEMAEVNPRQLHTLRAIQSLCAPIIDL